MRLIRHLSALALIGLIIQGSIQPAAARQPRVKIEFRLAESEPAEGLTRATVVGKDEKVYLHREAVITNREIVEARVVKCPYFTNRPRAGVARILGKKVRVWSFDIDNLFRIEVVFTKDGAEKMAGATEEHIGRPMAILIDGKVIEAPVVTARIYDKAAITGSFTEKEAERIAKGVNCCAARVVTAGQLDRTRVKLEFRLAEDKPAEGLTEAMMGRPGVKVYLHKEAIITNNDIIKARVVKDKDERTFSIEVFFTKEGAEKIARATEGHVGKLLAIVIDERVVSAYVVKERLSSDKARIFLEVTKAAAERIARGINRR